MRIAFLCELAVKAIQVFSISMVLSLNCFYSIFAKKHDSHSHLKCIKILLEIFGTFWNLLEMGERIQFWNWVNFYDLPSWHEWIFARIFVPFPSSLESNFSLMLRLLFHFWGQHQVIHFFQLLFRWHGWHPARLVFWCHFLR